MKRIPVIAFIHCWKLSNRALMVLALSIVFSIIHDMMMTGMLAPMPNVSGSRKPTLLEMLNGSMMPK